MDDPLDDPARQLKTVALACNRRVSARWLKFDASMGADTVECPHCGAKVACSLVFDDEVQCPECGKKFKKP